MSVQKQFSGFVRVRVYGQSRERFLNLCRNRKYRIWDIRPQDDHIEMCMSKDDFEDSAEAALKSDSRVDVVKKNGLPFFLRKIAFRKLFAAGVLFCLILLWLLQQSVWHINLSGNRSVTSEQITDFLSENDIHIGSKKRGINIEELEAAIRRAFEQTSWVSVTLRGTTLGIRIKENEYENSKENQSTQIQSGSDLTASCDGTIVSMIVRNGVPLVTNGSVIQTGDILVSSNIPVYDENSEICAYQYCRPVAEILVETSETYEDEISIYHTQKRYAEKTQTNLELHFPSFSIRFGKKITPAKQTELCYVQTDAALTQDLILPLKIDRITVKNYEAYEARYSYEDAGAILLERFEKYLLSFEEKGVQIMGKDVKMVKNGFTVQLRAELRLQKSIGNLTETD